MRLLHSLARTHASFDDPNLVSHAGLVPVMALAGRAVYALHGRNLTPRPGTVVPADAHVSWHAHQVFKGKPLSLDPPRNSSRFLRK